MGMVKDRAAGKQLTWRICRARSHNKYWTLGPRAPGKGLENGPPGRPEAG